MSATAKRWGLSSPNAAPLYCSIIWMSYKCGSLRKGFTAIKIFPVYVCLFHLFLSDFSLSFTYIIFLSHILRMEIWLTGCHSHISHWEKNELQGYAGLLAHEGMLAWSCHQLLQVVPLYLWGICLKFLPPPEI